MLVHYLTLLQGRTRDATQCRIILGLFWTVIFIGKIIVQMLDLVKPDFLIHCLSKQLRTVKFLVFLELCLIKVTSKVCIEHLEIIKLL
jgi:hypothetical protein